MELCPRQCLRRTLYAVMIGTSPIVICLLLIALARLILHQLETSYYRRQKLSDRRRSSSIFYQAGRPTLSYTPVSTTELQRIIQGKQSSESSSIIPKTENGSPKTSTFFKSILTRREPSPPNTLANLVIRRNAIGSTPLTALFAPMSMPVTPTFGMINEQRTRRPSAITITHESVETTTFATRNQKNTNEFFDTNNSFDAEQTETDPFLLSPRTMTTTTTTVVLEEFHDFHSVHSIPYALNLVS